MAKKFALVMASALAVALTATPALAKKGGNGNGNGNTPTPAPAPAPAPTLADCTATYGVVVSGAVDCEGFFAGNIFNQNDAGVQHTAVGNLGGSFNGNFSSVTGGSLSGNTVSFGQTLYGLTIVGMHFGNIANPNALTFGGQGNNENVSVLWSFDFGTTGASGITLLNTRGFSNAALYGTGNRVPPVPEPGTWALMILGFGAVGGALRAARKKASLSLA